MKIVVVVVGSEMPGAWRCLIRKQTTLTLTVFSYAQAFTVLTEAKKEDQRKRKTLHQFYEDTEECLDRMDNKIRTFLEQNIRNLEYKIAMNKQDLKQKEYVVLIAGELKYNNDKM